jgi:single-strand DNA-binding protein
MAAFNRVILVGNLTRDPEIKYLDSGVSITTFGLAVNERIKKGDAWEDYANFFDVTVFGKQGENCAEYLHKGSPALVEGKLRQRRWEKDGQKFSKHELVAHAVQFLGTNGGQRGGSPDGSEPPAGEDEAF